MPASIDGAAICLICVERKFLELVISVDKSTALVASYIEIAILPFVTTMCMAVHASIT